MTHDDLLKNRYSRQVRFAGIGEAGQRMMMQSRVLIVGCGALGTNLTNNLVRGGVGFIRIADRDFVEESNLQRQQLFTTQDVRGNLPKAEAARRRLDAINPHIEIDAHVLDVDSTNIEELARDVDLILDGSDNFEVRYLINDVAVKLGKPWVYAGVIGGSGMTCAFIPGRTGCLSCLFPESPTPGESGTCDTAGILNTTVQVIAGIQATRAMQILIGADAEALGKMTTYDVWENTFSAITLRAAPDCETCAKRTFTHLNAERGSFASSMCGRNAFQLSWQEKHQLDLDAIGNRLAQLGEVSTNPFLLKFSCEDATITLFKDGRAIIEGVDTAARARELYSRYIG